MQYKEKLYERNRDIPGSHSFQQQFFILESLLTIYILINKKKINLKYNSGFSFNRVHFNMASTFSPVLRFLNSKSTSQEKHFKITSKMKCVLLCFKLYNK